MTRVKSSKLRTTALLVLFLLSPVFSFSQISSSEQSRIVDSLKKEILQAKSDTDKIKSIMYLAKEFVSINIDSATLLANKALQISQKGNWQYFMGVSEHLLGALADMRNNFESSLWHFNKALLIWDNLISSNNHNASWLAKTRKAKTLNSIGVLYLNKDDYLTSLKYCFSSLELAIATNSKGSIADDYYNIALIYRDKGEFINALSYYFKAIPIAEEQKLTYLLGKIYGNMGVIYKHLKDYNKAHYYHTKGLEIAKITDDKDQIAISYSNIAIIYSLNGKYTMALNYFTKALNIVAALGDKGRIANDFGNIGSVYFDQGDSAINRGNEQLAKQFFYPKAMKNYLMALQICEEIDDKDGVSTFNGNIGGLYFAQKKFKEAEPYLLKSTKIAHELNAWSLIQEYEELLSRNYSELGNHKQALFHFKVYISARDSITNIDNHKKQVQLEMNYEFDKKELAAKVIQDKKDAIAMSEKNKQNLILNFVLVGLAFVLVFSFSLYKRYKVTKKQKAIIEKQKHAVDSAYNQLHEKNKEVMDSIHYAARIQRSLITSERYIKNQLKRLRKSV